MIGRLATAATFCIALLASPVAIAQDGDSRIRTIDSLSLPLFKSGILNLERTPSQISVGNPGIADILILRGSEVHVVAKALGSTNVVFWDRNDRIFATVDIEVTHDLPSLKEKLFTLLPNEDINVYSAQEKLVLKGTVSSASELQAALEIARSYLPECIEATSTTTDGSGQTVSVDGGSTNEEGCDKADVVNLLTVGGSQQVMLEVKIAEVSRTLMRTLDSDLSILNFGADRVGGLNAGGATFPNVPDADGLFTPLAPSFNNPISTPLGPYVDYYDPTTPAIDQSGLFFSRLLGDDFIQLALEISRSRGLSKILAEPNLTTLTGRPAKFLSGGEFPIIVRDDDGYTVIYREFGVIVDFLPTILDGERISLDLELEVSEIRDFVGGVNDLAPSYPIIDKRGASSTVELKNGQTIGIAGLIQDNLTETLTRMPGLGDIPILGNLFRSQDFMSGQTELVMFVTPHLAKPIAPDLIKLPTDSFVAPNDVEFYLLGQMASSREPERKSYRKILDGGFDGVTFGHSM